MPDFRDLLTPAEASVVSGVALRTVYKILAQRLPRGLVARRDRHVYVTPAGAMCLWLDRQMPREAPAKVRKAVYRQVKPSSVQLIEYQWGALRCVIDPKPAADGIASGLAAYRRAMDAIMQDDDIQGGAATFKGTRLLVHHIADLLAQGVPAAELKADYPNLTDAMIAAAPVFARANPRRGRPRAPAWRGAQPVRERRMARRA